MKYLYCLFISTFIFNVNTFALEQEENILGKRPSSTELDEPPKKKQVFVRPTSDAVFKHVLQDDIALESLIKAFLGIKNLTKIYRLDEFLNPIKPHGNVREIINGSDMKALMKDPDDFIVYRKVSGDKEVKCTDNKQNIFKDLSKIYGDLKDLIPKKDRESKVDVICKLENKQYFMLEVQVAKEINWDYRAVAYASKVYGSQLKEGDSWSKLMPVVAINILGRDNIKCWEEDAAPFRSYILIDEYNNSNKIPAIRLFQCCLYNLDLEKKTKIREDLKARKELLEWLDYFKYAHRKDRIPEGIDEGLKLAYQKAAIENLPSHMLKMYETKEKLIENFERIIEENRQALIDEGMQKGIEVGVQKGKEEGIREGAQNTMKQMAKKMLDKGHKLEEIAEMLDISIDEMKRLITD